MCDAGFGDAYAVGGGEAGLSWQVLPLAAFVELAEEVLFEPDLVAVHEEHFIIEQSRQALHDLVVVQEELVETQRTQH